MNLFFLCQLHIIEKETSSMEYLYRCISSILSKSVLHDNISLLLILYAIMIACLKCRISVQDPFVISYTIHYTLPQNADQLLRKVIIFFIFKLFLSVVLTWIARYCTFHVYKIPYRIDLKRKRKKKR